ncbi:NAD+ synthase [Rickettsiales bacterium LUAb2]
MQNLKIGILQIDFTLGNIEGNTNKIKQYYQQNSNLDLIIVNELCVSGYISLDNLYKIQFQNAVKQAIAELAIVTQNAKPMLIVGDIYVEENTLFNVAYCLAKGEVQHIVKKQKLVNYDVFTENRYFVPGDKSVINHIELNGYRLGLVVCEDLWHQDIIDKLVGLNLDLVISINASPYETTKFYNRFNVVEKTAILSKVPVIYSNLVGAVDGIVFDGRSFVVDYKGKQQLEMALVEEDFKTLELSPQKQITITDKAANTSNFTNLGAVDYAEIYAVIQKGLLDFIIKNNLQGVIIGLSGGVDSALSSIVAVDTLGAENVLGISIPSSFTSQLSLNIISELSNNLGIKLQTIELDQILTEYITKVTNNTLVFKSKITEENLQSRIRGSLLMAVSNENERFVVLSNGNKSELATGYFTLYGDSCGAFNVLKDLYKKDVYNLINWRNNNIPKLTKLEKTNIIPKECIERPPTAELKFDQKDEDSLLPYNLLDQILEDIIENNLAYNKLISKYQQSDVDWVIKALKNSEYKRKQSVIGVKLGQKSFGVEWKFPITNQYRE